jgi:ABC-type Fe3+/spermidine/putrescine transport system ATPase subunit
MISDRVVVMAAGRIVQSARPLELYDNPASPYVAQLIGAANLVHGHVARYAGSELEIDVGGARLRGRPAAAAPALAVGAPAVACIRPERISLGAGVEAGDTPIASAPTISVRVRERCFLGDILRLETEIDGAGQRIIVDVHRSGDGIDIPAVGDQLTLGIRPADVIVFAAGPP